MRDAYCAWYRLKALLSRRSYDRAMIASALKWALILGGIGLVAGYIGPLIFTPEANQGPLLGIFITGPIFFVVGLVYGAVVSALR